MLFLPVLISPILVTGATVLLLSSCDWQARVLGHG